MISRTNAQLLKAALNSERRILDATIGRIMRARQTYAATDYAVEEYTRDSSEHVAAASASIEQLIEALDTFIRS